MAAKLRSEIRANIEAEIGAASRKVDSLLSGKTAERTLSEKPRNVLSAVQCRECSGQGLCAHCEGPGSNCQKCMGSGFCSVCWGLGMLYS
jgi:hypothetical protein